MTRLFYTALLLLIPLLFTALPKKSAMAEELSSPLLLLFDVELDEDNIAFTSLNFQDFGSFFIDAQFAEKYPDTVRKLADQGTLGVFSKAYALLKNEGLLAAKNDLLASQKALEQITGENPVWLRVPADHVDRDLFSLASEVGFRFDASEAENALSQNVLGEFPVSTNSTDRILFSDFDLFVTYGLDDRMALELLKENYLNRKESGRPFVLQLHPSIIVQHGAVLQDFVKYVKQQGGPCLSLDQYFSRGEQQEHRVGLHIDPGVGDIEIKETVRNVLEFGVTDVFVPVMDADGNRYFVAGGEPLAEPQIRSRFELLLRSLAAAGIKTHFSLPVLYNPHEIAGNKEAAMVDQKGRSSDLWLSPSFSGTKKLLLQNINTLISQYNVEGIHLTHLAYPGLDYDYSPVAIKGFEKVNDLIVQRGRTAEQLQSEYYQQWTHWRIKQIEDLILSAREVVKNGGPDVLFSAGFSDRSMQEATVRLETGCDVRLLAAQLDMVVVGTSINTFLITTFSLPRLTAAGRSVAGLKPLFFQLPVDRGQGWSAYGVTHLLNSMADVQRKQLTGIIYPFYDQLMTDSILAGENFTNIFALTRTFIQGKTVEKKTVQMTDVQPSPVADPPDEEVKDAWPSFLYTMDKEQVYDVIFRFAPLIVSLILTLLGLLLIAYFLFIKKVFSKKNSMSMETTTIIDWQSMDQSILNEQISGKLVHSVSRLLQTYKPQSAARYRMGLLIHLVGDNEGGLSAQQLGLLEVKIPDWRILSQKYLNEAMLHGYVEECNSGLQVTQAGRQELASLREEGFNPGQWIFVEQRMEEKLLVNCPQCGQENVGQWYTREFVCTGCEAVITYRECTSIERIPFNVVSHNGEG